MSLELSPPWDDLTFLAPLSPRRADTLVRFVAGAVDPASGPVVDLGCGWAELLLQVLAAVPGAAGVGVDRDADALAAGRTSAAARGLDGRVELRVGDAVPARAAAVLSVGATHAWAPPAGPDPEPLHYEQALRRVRSLVPRGAPVVYADGIWRRPPTPAAVAPLAGREDELLPLADLAELAVACGFGVVGVHEADQGEWDDFESGYTACYARWLASHEPDDPQADRVREAAARQRTGYLSGYRGVMGFGYLQLLAV
ncbi:SAM-dependent methyltransferase [Lapillicoccus jejuensis]|uniref:Cyclopropane fatty-acyl-phospholipid synthase-like methyltransferase n=1 Tax=Lapillicoccus jejuensis TaxID=402171 RepID=A0A542E3S9_9MICO|nr:class I SAM-dependent methyltransferase [Lapillicoccus jejuensis]TQJ09975.1 cyclopropane fatty-acyl-phospholipid synthase-like methyltransferase [Lapillicoccus jejuensis]